LEEDDVATQIRHYSFDIMKWVLGRRLNKMREMQFQDDTNEDDEKRFLLIGHDLNKAERSPNYNSTNADYVVRNQKCVLEWM
jgi:hypothetical protein